MQINVDRVKWTIIFSPSNTFEVQVMNNMSKNRLDKVSIRLVSILSKMMYNNCVVEIIVNNQSKQHLYFFLKNLVQKLALFASQSMHLIWPSFKNIFASPWIPFIFFFAFVLLKNWEFVNKNLLFRLFSIKYLNDWMVLFKYGTK